MAGTNPNCCLKCNSPTHRFSELEKCVYGKTGLMTRACFSCGAGAHHFSACIKNLKPPVGAPAVKAQETLDPRFSKYPTENTKNVPERQPWETPFPKEKNAELPPLFQW